MMDLVRLSHEHNLSGFDCGDKDLNEFLTDDGNFFADSVIWGYYRFGLISVGANLLSRLDSGLYTT